MTHLRTLRFERLEARLPLSVGVQSLLAELHSDASSDGIGQQAYLDLMNRIEDAREMSSERIRQTSLASLMPAEGIPMVKFRVDILDSNNQTMFEVKAGHEYLARVFVQDAREATGENPANGGIFQAIVDLHFSPNLRIVGEIRVSELFDGGRLNAEIADTSARNVGGFNATTTVIHMAETLLLEAPFVVDHTEVATRVQVTPSTSSDEAVLAHGLDFPVPIDRIRSAAFEVPAVTTNRPRGTLRPAGERGLATGWPERLTVPPQPPEFPRRMSERAFLISFSSAFGSDGPSKWDWSIEDQRRRHRESFPDDESEPGQTDDLHWPDPEDFEELIDPTELRRKVFRTDRDDLGSEGEDEDSKHAGLFYDESLFLEGALVEPFRSTFRLHFQVFAPQGPPFKKTSEGFVDRDTSNRCDDFVDLAEILAPHSPSIRWHHSVDEAIAGPPVDGGEGVRHPTVDWAMWRVMSERIEERALEEMSESVRPVSGQRPPLSTTRSASEAPETAPPTEPRGNE